MITYKATWVQDAAQARIQELERLVREMGKVIKNLPILMNKCHIDKVREILNRPQVRVIMESGPALESPSGRP